MTRIRKVLLSVLLSVIMLIKPMTVEATDSFGTAMEVGTPYRWSNTSSVNISFSIINGIATFDIAVQGYPEVDLIEADIILSRQDSTYFYSHVYSWSNLSQSGNYFHFFATYPVNNGYTYRITILGQVYKNGVSEAINLYKEAS